jgi:hypothetical protein
MEALERFAALVIARREAQSIHTCPPDCQKPLCVNRRREIAEAVEAEREACARVCDKRGEQSRVDGWYRQSDAELRCADAIRARGSK